MEPKLLGSTELISVLADSTFGQFERNEIVESIAYRAREEYYAANPNGSVLEANTVQYCHVLEFVLHEKLRIKQSVLDVVKFIKEILHLRRTGTDENIQKANAMVIERNFKVYVIERSEYGFITFSPPAGTGVDLCVHFKLFMLTEDLLKMRSYLERNPEMKSSFLADGYCVPYDVFLNRYLKKACVRDIEGGELIMDLGHLSDEMLFGTHGYIVLNNANPYYGLQYIETSAESEYSEELSTLYSDVMSMYSAFKTNMAGRVFHHSEFMNLIMNKRPEWYSTVYDALKEEVQGSFFNLSLTDSGYLTNLLKITLHSLHTHNISSVQYKFQEAMEPKIIDFGKRRALK